MRCIAARLLLIFFIYLCLSFGVFGSFSIWLSLSVGLSVVVHPLFFYCVCLLFLVFTCAQFINPLCTPCVYQLHTYLYQRVYFGFLYLEWTRMSVVLMVLLSFSAVFFFLILFAIFIIIIVVTIIVILHRLSALPMDTLTDLFGSLIIVCNSSLLNFFYKWICVWMVYMCCFRRLTLNIVIKGSKRYKNNT